VLVVAVVLVSSSDAALGRDRRRSAAFLAPPPQVVRSTRAPPAPPAPAAFGMDPKDGGGGLEGGDDPDPSPVRGPDVQPPRPNGCTYWASEHLLAGEYPTDRGGDDGATRRKIRGYLDAGVTVFLDLTEEGERGPYESVLMDEAARFGKKDVVHRRVPVPDFGVPTERAMTEVLDAIDAAERDGRRAYVHCRGGIGRTGTAVGCHLVRRGAGGDEALVEVNRLFRSSEQVRKSWRSPETDEQEEFVRGWAEGR